MGDMLQTGVQWLADQQAASAAMTVVYRRGAQSVSVLAVLGSSLLRVVDNDGQTRTVRTDRDFLIRVADLKLGGVLVTPTDGDWIEVVLNGITERFEVMPVLSEPAWRYSDSHKVRYRIHSKKRDTL